MFVIFQKKYKFCFIVYMKEPIHFENEALNYSWWGAQSNVERFIKLSTACLCVYFLRIYF